MRTWQRIVLALAVTAMAGIAQGAPAAIGVYYDTAATQTTYTFAGGPENTFNAYIYATDTDQIVGGAAFKLELDSRINFEGASFPAGVQIGTLLEGIQIGFTEPAFGMLGTPVRLARVVLSTHPNSMSDAELRIVGYPGSDNVELSDADGNLRVIDGGVSYLTVPPRSTIGVYFDTAATQTTATFLGGFDGEGQPDQHRAYIYAVNTNILVGGACFMLQLDPAITLESASFPAGVQIGTLTEGIQIAFTECAFGMLDTPVRLASFYFSTGYNLLNNAEMSIVADPTSGEIQLANCQAEITNPDGGTAYLTVPVPTETKSWSQIKNLYGN